MLIISLFLFSALTMGQDEKAGSILDRMSEQTRSAPSVSIDFTVIMSSLQDDIIEEFDGRLTLKGEKYRVTVSGMESWFDGTSVYTYMTDVNEVMISDPDEDGGLLSSPSRLFNIYSEEFRYRFIGESNLSGRVLYEIDLHPLDLEQDFHTVKLFIDSADNFIQSAVIAGKDGHRYTFLVNEFTSSKEVPDSFFVFNKQDYPGVEIIDMRW